MVKLKSVFSKGISRLTAVALSAVALYSCPLPAFGAHLSADQALARARSTAQCRKAVRAGSMPRLAESSGMIYVFNSADGYIVLPADDCAPAVLGYSDRGEYVPGTNAQLDWWLSCYDSQIRYAAANGAAPYKAGQAATDRAPIEPIVKTEWNQEAPYNELCPRVNGHEVVTGCVATAMAQVIRTHRHPYRPTGKHSYEWKAEYHGFSVDSTLAMDYDTVSFVFGDMPYKYDKSSTDVQKHAVAELMLACGISVDMGYNIGDSGASTIKMGVSLMQYFKYDEGAWMPERNYYGLEEWQDMIYGDLAQGLPVLYSGQGTGGGHQFICDGYSSDGYFHFNWGWGGMSNGYFLLDALNPGSLGVGGGAGGFNYSQQITLNLKPAVEGSKWTYIVYCGNFSASTLAPSVDEEVTFGGTYFNYSLHTLPEGCYYGLRIVSADGDTTYVEGNETMKLPPLDGQESFRAKWPSLPDGTYTVCPAMKDNYGDWNLIRSSLDQHGSYTAVVADGKTALSQEPLPEAVVSALALNSKLYVGKQCGISFTVENNGESEYVWSVAPALLDSEGKVAATAPALEIDLVGGASRVIDDYVVTFTAVSTSTSAKRRATAELTPGDYTLAIVNSKTNAVLTTTDAEVPVTVETPPAETKVEVSDFTVNDGKTITSDRSSVPLKFTLTCTEGYCSDNVWVFMFKDSGDRYDVMSHSFQAPLISAGQDVVESADVDLSSLEDGSYRAWVYYGGSYIGDPAGFTIKLESDVSGCADTAADSPAPMYFDLLGRPVGNHPGPGIYIHAGKLFRIEGF